MKGTWEGYFKQIEEGKVQIEFIEKVEVHSAIMKLLAKPYLKSQQKRYIQDLENKIKQG